MVRFKNYVNDVYLNSYNADGIIISKKRYLIPLTGRLTIELDIFEGDLAPLKLAEVEFETKEEAESFLPPKWFGKDVTFSSDYHNSTLSKGRR